MSFYPGEYFITFESANYRDVRVSLDFNVKYNFAVNTYSNDIDNIYEDGEIESPNYGEGVESEGGCLQGPGGCGGAFDTQGFGPFSPLNPNFGQ